MKEEKERKDAGRRLHPAEDETAKKGKKKKKGNFL